MRIIADSSCDLQGLDWEDFRTVPLTIYTDERSFVDEPDLNVTDMLDYLARFRGRSYTSCPSAEAWLNAFTGAREIFVMTVTSSLSGSYASAMMAAKQYMEENPGAKVSVIDSLSTGGEEVLVLHKLAELAHTDMTFEEIDQAIRDYLLHTRLFFAFFSVHNLSQNGRVSKTAAAALSMFNIAVTGTATETGTINVNGKARGERGALKNIYKAALEAGYTGDRAVITHVENPELASCLKNMVRQDYPDAEVLIFPTRGLCSYYMERRGIVFSCETAGK